MIGRDFLKINVGRHQEMPKLIKLPPIQNVAANQTCVLPQVPHGMTYLSLILELGGTTMTKALLTGIRSRINGKQFVDVTGAHLDKQNLYKTKTANAAYCSLDFAERKARTIIGEEIGAIDTSVGVDTFDFEFDIGAATAPTLAAHAMIAPPKQILINGQPNQNKRTISAILKKVHSLSGAANHNVMMPLGSRLGGLIKRVHLHHAYVTAVEVRKDGTYLQQEGKIGLVSFIQDELNRAKQSGHVSYDPMFTDNQSDAVSTIRDDGTPASFEFSIATSAGDTVTSYTELYTTINRL